jgi:type IV pilus assembly protein PilO
MINFRGILDELKNIDFTEIRLDNVGSWPLIVRILACVLTLVLATGGYWYFRINALNTTFSNAVASETQLREQFSQRAFQAANLEAYRLQLEELELRLETLIGQLPTDTEVPGLLEDVTETGLGSGLTIENIILEPEIAHDYYVELPINIVATGGYHDFATFVSGVAGLPRIVTLHDFSISGDNEVLLTMNIDAKTYRYRDAGE